MQTLGILTVEKIGTETNGHGTPLTASVLSIAMALAPSHINAPIGVNDTHLLHAMTPVPAPSGVNDVLAYISITLAI